MQGAQDDETDGFRDPPDCYVDTNGEDEAEVSSGPTSLVDTLAARLLEECEPVGDLAASAEACAQLLHHFCERMGATTGTDPKELAEALLSEARNRHQ